MKKIWYFCLLLPMLAGACARTEAVVYDIADRAVSAGEAEGPEEPDAETASQSGEPATICVYICGAVERPDVYELPAGSRVFEAVAAAGGMTEAADPRALNLAEFLTDGQQITVFTREETESGLAEGAANSPAGGEATRVNLNTATKEQLMTLPGIGEVKAEAILSYREENRRFSAIEEIREISGIGEKSFEKLKDLITV